MSNSLEKLRANTIIVADSGDVEAIKGFTPTHATTNPLIVLAASKLPAYKPLVEKAVKYGKQHAKTAEKQAENAMDMLYVLIGCEVLKVIPGRISTQVDTRLVFDKEASIAKARKLVKLYIDEGVPKERVLIKLPSTWEGIQAAKELREKYKIDANMTLLFNIVQAVACAESGLKVVSPFIGGIEKWHQENTEKKSFTIENHPGILTTKNIFNYYKKFDYETEILGAYVTRADEAIGLAGLDSITISPDVLKDLKNSDVAVPKVLNKHDVGNLSIERLELNEAKFRWLMNEDEMATGLMAAGIRMFAKACQELEENLKKLIVSSK